MLLGERPWPIYLMPTLGPDWRSLAVGYHLGPHQPVPRKHVRPRAETRSRGFRSKAKWQAQCSASDHSSPALQQGQFDKENPLNCNNQAEVKRWLGKHIEGGDAPPAGQTFQLPDRKDAAPAASSDQRCCTAPFTVVGVEIPVQRPATAGSFPPPTA